jgi:hypothetical protein
MRIKIISLITLLGLSCYSFADGNMKYLGFEFGKNPDPEFLKNFKCNPVGSFKLCKNTNNGKTYSVSIDGNNIVRKVSQSISSSSSKNNFNCLKQIQAYADVLNDDYQANITKSSYGLFDSFETTIYKNNTSYLASGNCENLAEDIRFNTSIEDATYQKEYSDEENSLDKSSNTDSVKRDFE